MNKKLLAVAIASAIAAPLAMADAGNVTITGNAGAGVTSVKTIAGNRAADVGSAGADLAISGSESLGNGLKAVFLLKTFVNLTDSGTGNDKLLFGKTKDAYVGLSGAFGTVALGAHGQPFKTATGGLELFGDSIADARGSITNGAGAFHSGIGDAVIWFLPSINGFSGHAQYGTENNVVNAANAVGAQLNYSNGPLYVAVAMADNDLAGATNRKGSKAGVGYSFGDTTINLVTERTKLGTEKAVVASSIGMAHKFGANTVKLQHASSNHDPSGTTLDNPSLWAVGLDHSLSKRTTLYGLFADGDNLASDKIDSGFEVGIGHSF